MIPIRKFYTILLLFLMIYMINLSLKADDGYRLWLKYDKIENEAIRESYKKLIQKTFLIGNSSVMQVVENELSMALHGLLGQPLLHNNDLTQNTLIIALENDLPSAILDREKYATSLTGDNFSDQGFVIRTIRKSAVTYTVITARGESGLLYGVFHFIRLLQTCQDIDNLNIKSSPKIKHRVLNHWDNLDRTVERGYSGFSLWDWQKLPDYIHSYYIDYARANASVGINGTVLNNVNASPQILTPLYLKKVAALADVFRPYGIKVYLSIRFSAPIDIGGLKRADPLDSEVRQWWADKAAEIYELIPNFGGFLVKANSEGQPGPQDYGRTHADGANMLAEALKPHGGVVMWRAFVYDNKVKEDRAKQAYNEFVLLDGQFNDNVLVQVKNGPIDFQPREPFHPLFGATPKTSLMMEFQITQEYLGFSTHLVYLGTLFKEVLDADTYVRDMGSTVAKVIDGSLHGHSISGIAGVANTGTDRNWTGHIFAQANWYAYGRLAWDHTLTAEEIARDWIKMTLSRDDDIVNPILEMMMESRENTVNYMTPLGLHHIMGWDHHYGPAPWIKDKPRDDWTSVYYHRANEEGIGFDRTETGSNAVSLYAKPVRQKFSSLETCPDEYLLWFHHLDWTYVMRSGNTLWDELCYRYYDGAERVTRMKEAWNDLQDKIDDEIYNHVKQMMIIHEKEAIWWRNACVLYFQTFSGLPIPTDLVRPDKSLEYYMNLSFPFAPK
ncbi:alpha-glucuronidase [candidate division KSB1 bacterium]|nr:alpha-glucuronidase [candidate division KSB1 bacterium]